MKANLDKDKIINISSEGSTEIGNFSKDIGLERIRWNGSEAIDLNTLTEIWVRCIHGGFDLHSIEYPECQLVQMTYPERQNLINDAGIIRLKTSLELEDDTKNNFNNMLKNRLRKKLDGDTGDQLADLYKLVFLLIQFIRTDDAVLATFFDDLLPAIESIYPQDTAKTKLNLFIQDLETNMADYYQEKL